MSFTAALHTYFTISSIDQVTVQGLEGVTYTDSLAGGREVEQQGPVVFDQEVDRIYLATPQAPIKVGQELVVAGVAAASPLKQEAGAINQGPRLLQSFAAPGAQQHSNAHAEGF